MKRIYLEITNSCDLDCPFCSEPKGHSFMSLADIDRYTDEIRPYCGYIYLHVLGEPLLHPCIDEILDILERKDFRLQLVTNGVHLGEHPDLINHKCLRKLSVSLHAVDRLNIGTAYFRTVDELIERHGDTVLELRFFDPANLSGDTLGYLQSLKERYELLETGKKNSYEISKDVYVLFEGMFEWPDLKLPFISYEGKCHGFIDQLAILCDGRVTSCCLDARGFNCFGDMKKMSFKDIIESDTYLKSCKELKKGILSHELCARCSYRLRFSHTHD